MVLPRTVPLLALSAVLTGLLGACGGPTGAAGRSPAIVSAPPPRAPAGPHPAPGLREPLPMAIPPGLEGVVGADADQLARLFGPPRIDVREADARKLQWSGTACILDAYLYPGARGGRPLASFVDARRGDGRDVDKAACVAALRRQPPGAPGTPAP